VEDNGVGIPSEALPRVTERYYRVGNHPVGSGLGLSISKEIVRLHGGTIKVASPPPGKPNGTVVAIRLPLAGPVAVLLVAAEPGRQAALEAAAGGLREYGFVVRLAGDAEGGVKLAREFPPDCVLVDAARDHRGVLRFRTDEALAGVPVVALVAEQTDDVVRKVLGDLAVATLSEPLQGEAVVDGVEAAIISVHLQQEMAPLPAGKEAAS
jgi:CheY-like chemotaxis protein